MLLLFWFVNLLNLNAAQPLHELTFDVVLLVKLKCGVVLVFDSTGRSKAMPNYQPTARCWGSLAEKCKWWKDKCNYKWSFDY